MKVGDLVRVTWQPRIGAGGRPIKHAIKGRIGFVSSIRNEWSCFVCFPELAYTHPLAHGAFEVISEDR